MSLLVNYVQPLTNWLQQNPHWALLITFLISLSESLAIIGSIVPGSVTMTAIGILAGSGIMRIDLTLLAAILGAIAGDSLSYFLGYVYSERLLEIWPFKKYPKAIQYGKEFIALHGGKSVLLGRFIGPLRSLIPVIAGILHMKHWRFFIANVISAIGWSLLYVMPGVLIGAASHELSTESASRLFVIILLLLASIWVLSFIIKWLFNRFHSFSKKYLHLFWLKLRDNNFLTNAVDFVTPKNEKNHYTTAILALLTCTCLIFFIILTGLAVQHHWIESINRPVHFLAQSFHNHIIEAFFIFCTQLTAIPTIITIYLICSFWFFIHKDRRAGIYFTSVVFLTYSLASFLNHSITNYRPPGLLVLLPGFSYPSLSLMTATACYGFVLFYINQAYLLFTNALRTFVFTVLGLSGLGAIYLGDYWLVDILASYLGGTFICLIHCLMYRKYTNATVRVKYGIEMGLTLLIGILVSTVTITYFNFHTLVHNHTPYRKEFSLNQSAWWNQTKPLLPIYRLNRIGKRENLLNIQYAGSLELLKDNLEESGWKQYTESFLNNLLMRINKQGNEAKFPLFAPLYENKAPELIMVYHDAQDQTIYELRIWESNYILTETLNPLWIGSIYNSKVKKYQKNYRSAFIPSIDPLYQLEKLEKKFDFKKIVLPDTMIKQTLYPTAPFILLMKEKAINKN